MTFGTCRLAKDNQDPDTDRQLHQTADSNKGQGEQLNTNQDSLQGQENNGPAS